MLSRRRFVKLCAILTGGLQLGALQGCGGMGADDRPTLRGTTGKTLPIPGLLEGTLEGDVRVYNLNLQQGSKEWIEGKPTKTYGINGDVLGPTLRLRKGEKVRIDIHNELGEVSTIHWHGIHLPPASDGGPYSPIADGETWSAPFEVMNEPMIAWYHPHFMHKTARHVYMGMAGVLLIEEENPSVVLPSAYGVDDVPLVIQDRRFYTDGTHPYSKGNSPVHFDIMAGLKGGNILVNGEIVPRHETPRGLIRLRLLNGSNARFYHLGFEDDRDFNVIASDGGLLTRPLTRNRVILAPAERVEILVDFSKDTQGNELLLKSFSREIYGTMISSSGGMAGMADEMLDPLDKGTFDVMTFVMGDAVAEVLSVPSELNTIARIPESEATHTRTIELNMKSGGVYINGQQMNDMNNVHPAINLQIPLGSVEIWEIKNSSAMMHPFHVHDVQFQILDIKGAAPPEELMGWKDTVRVLPNSTVRIIMRFEDFKDPDVPFMFHCHILEHEDDGMMGQFYVV